MSESQHTGIGDPSPEDCRRVAQDLREKGMTVLPDKLDQYAEKLEADADE